MDDRYLFRGKSADADDWRIGTLHFVHGKPSIVPETFFDYWKESAAFTSSTAMKSNTIGQCTGLRDKHGERIFEGDIVKCKEYGKDNGKGANFAAYDIFAITWHDGHFYIENGTRQFGLRNRPGIYEIIGNIHDNADLLEVK